LTPWFFFHRQRMTNLCPGLSIWFCNVFVTCRIVSWWMQAHCKFLSGWFDYNIAWALDALTINATHIPFGRMALEIAMRSHHVLTML
jgi:hypothetical protein